MKTHNHNSHRATATAHTAPVAGTTHHPAEDRAAVAARTPPALAAELWAAHFEQVRSECAALAPTDLVQLSLDVPTAVTTALGALPGIRAMRARIAALPDIDMAPIDKLETYARAAQYAHSVHLGAAEPSGELPSLYARAVESRGMLVAAVQALAKKKLLAADCIAELHTNTGYREAAADLIALAAVFHGAWSRVSGRTAVEPADLADADRLANEILVAVGERDQGASVQSQAAADRHRAVTLFVRTYDQVRRAVCFLRWNEDDAERIAPPLYKRDRAVRRRNAGESGTGPGSTPPPAPSATP